MDPDVWPPLAVAAVLLPLIRRELVGHARPPRVAPGPPIDLCAIVEDGLFGYELAPHAITLPFLIIGCGSDGVARLRRTSFDPLRDPGLRLATVEGAPVSVPSIRSRRSPRSAELLFSDWATAAQEAWAALDPALDVAGHQWEASMVACASLEHALAVASERLQAWSPTVDFCGLVHQAQYGLPLRGAEGASGTLTLHSPPGLWMLRWGAGRTLIEIEIAAPVNPLPAAG